MVYCIVGKFGGDNDKVDEDFGKKRFGNEEIGLKVIINVNY